ncbi:MAG: phosphatase PAP2 family protein [Chlamydiia bacterium]|nr:phosphatase PAP2 family protein [Chlamydiia bacterium]
MIYLRNSFFLALLATLSYFFLDIPITTSIAPHSKEFYPFSKGCTLLIFPPLYLALPLIGYLISRFKKSRWTFHFFVIFTAQCLSVAFVRVFKVLIGRARPDIFLKKGIFGFYGFEWNHHFHSFPSGHTMAAFTLATSLSLLFPKGRYLFFTGATLLSLSRIFLLGHFLSDVIGAAAIALIIGKGVHHLCNHITWRHVNETA